MSANEAAAELPEGVRLQSLPPSSRFSRPLPVAAVLAEPVLQQLDVV